MVTRCIAALNELDKVSQKVSHRHSQKRLRDNTEAKLKLAKKKTDEAFQECDTKTRRTPSVVKNRAPGGRNELKRKDPTSSPLSSKLLGNEKPKSTAKFSKSAVVSPDKEQDLESQGTKSWSACSLKNTPTKCKTGPAVNATALRPVSIYGRHTEAESKYTPTAWFNFTEETSVGVIDAFACDASNVRPLCYKVDKTHTKGVPRLLRHRAEVRVGQNGVVRNAGAQTETVPHSQGGVDKRQEQALDGKVEKERVAPLSWDEQVNWKDVKCILRKVSGPEDQDDKGLCETRPVIFHPKAKTEKRVSRVKCARDVSSARSPAYRLYVETRTLSADRRNLVASPQGKLLTEIGVEDAREGEEVNTGNNESRERFSEMKESFDKDKVDTTCAAVSMLRENSECMVPADLIQDPADKIPKKVSFDGESREESAQKPLENVNNVGDDIAEPRRTTLTRPKTSRERLLRTRDFDGVAQPRRPYTAPPSTPRHYHDNEVKAVNHYAPVIIPTSRRDSNDTENTDADSAVEHKTGHVPEDKVFEMPKVEENVSEEGGKARKTASKLRVTFAPMSAPARQVPQRDGTNRSKSATLHRQKAYSPPPPVVVMSDSSLELPNDLSPADALLSLRKKIREDLEQQNRDLQLDIQQLHLTRHSENV